MGPLSALEDLKFYTMTTGEQFVIVIGVCMRLRWRAESWAVGQHNIPQTQPILVKELEKCCSIKQTAQEEKGF